MNSRQESRSLFSRWQLVLAAVVVATLSGPVQGAVYTLTDGNSEVLVDTSTSFGAHSWVIDGTDHLSQQWLWYRIGGATEMPINTLVSSGVTYDALNPSSITASYSHASFTLSVQFILSGGAGGSGLATLQQVVTVSNSTHNPLSLTLLQYIDQDVDGEFDDNLVTIGGNTVTQEGPFGTTLTTTSSQSPSQYAVAFWGDQLDLLSDLSSDSFGFDGGPLLGDVTFGLQYDLALGGHQSTGFTITSSTGGVVPEPGTAVLLLAGSAVTFLRRRRNR